LIFCRFSNYFQYHFTWQIPVLQRSLICHPHTLQ
jgi:hypothetical protein